MTLLKCCTQYTSKYENSAVATGLGKVSFHSSPKERQCQRMFKLPYNCSHCTCQQGNTQNSSSQASIISEPRTSRCSSWVQKRQRNQRYVCWQQILPTSFGSQKKQENYRKKTSTSASLTTQKPLTVQIITNWKILKKVGIPDQLICLLKNLYVGQEATVTTIHGAMAWFQVGKGVHQGCVLSPCLFNLYVQYIM